MKRASAVLLLTACAAALWLALRDGRPASPPTASPPPPAPPSAQAKTRVLSYALRYDSRMRASPWSDALPSGSGPQVLDASLELDAELHLRLTPRGRGAWVAIGFSSLNAAQVSALGQRAFADLEAAEKTLLGSTLHATLDADGVIDALYDEARTDLLASNVLQAILQEWSVVARRDLPRRTRQPLPFGLARVDYGQQGDELVRQITGYESLRALPHDLLGVTVEPAGRDLARSSPAGNLASLRGRHTLLAKRGNAVLIDAERDLELVLLAEHEEPAQSFDPSRYLAREPQSAATSRELARRLLEARADGLQSAELVRLLELHGLSGRFPDHAQTFWRATALLALDPSAVHALRPLFLAAGGNDHKKALILDLLASAGTPEAQALLRELITSDAARSEPRYPLLYQRLGMIEEPTAETQALAVEAYQAAQARGDENLATASLYTLGAVAGATAENTGASAAAPMIALLQRALTTARSTDELELAINAYANAREPNAALTLGAYTAHPTAKVRASVARALEKPTSERGTRTLLELLADSSASVQRASLVSLRAHGLDARAFTKLIEQARAGGIHPSNQRVALDLVKHSAAEQRALARDFLDALAAGGIPDPEVRSAVATWRAAL